MKPQTVCDMYKYSSAEGTRLLSDYGSEFWKDYVDNFQRYDNAFYRMFRSFWYFMQEPDDDIQKVTTDFTNDVYNHLLINDKKYSELYRVHVIADKDYSITDNYNVIEQMERETTDNDKNTLGERTDKNTDNFGKRTDNTTTDIGERTDNMTTEIGEQVNTDTNTIAGFNSDSFENDNQLTANLGNRTDNSTTTTGSRSDSSTATTGEQTNNSTYERGGQVNNHEGTGTENYKLTRVGNIGVTTITEVIRQHTDFWSKWDFYNMIFKEICAELLLV